MRWMVTIAITAWLAACAGPANRDSGDTTSKRAGQTRDLDDICRTYEAQRSDPRCQDYRSSRRRPADSTGTLPVEIPPKLPVNLP